ncbi:hypothetical protein J1614_000669 [Plenodomus biglobosus]|nr:hypothetical protein J1614_000669 [Plenodomus biglobosus]
MSSSWERYPSSANEASAALQINRTLGQHSDTESNGDDPQYLPTHTCSCCQRVFESSWLDDHGNIVDSPMDDSKLRIELGNLWDIDEAVGRGCEFYQRLQCNSAGNTVKAFMRPESDKVLLFVISKQISEYFECYALNRRIIQDDKEDVAYEVAHQADIYRESTFTILAGDCASADDGFLHTRPMPVERFRISVRPPGTSDVGSWLIMSVDQPRRRNPIEKRGWILQECKPAHPFIPRQLMIYCNDRMYADGGNETHEFATTWLRRNCYSGRINAESAAKIWDNLVQCYSEMSVSKSSDKLAAISAAAEEIGGLVWEPHEIHTSYKAGLWIQHMPKSLLWYRECMPCLPRPPYRAPSWSWASIDGLVTHTRSSTDTTYDYRIRVVSCTTTSAFSSAPFGEVLGGELRLLGPLKTVSSYNIDGHYITVCDADHNLRLVCFVDALEPELGKKSSDSDAKISVLLCASEKLRFDTNGRAIRLYGLFLTSRSSEPAFRRIGFWYYEYTDAEEMKWFATFETTEITII